MDRIYSKTCEKNEINYSARDVAKYEVEYGARWAAKYFSELGGTLW